tara:strand:- start:281 stop:1093 length:813 start_codon:yes stop_codon:yes gene_type:complete
MPWDNDAYNSTRSITALVKAACASKNLLIPSPLSFHDVARLIEVDEDESVSPREDQDDPLAQELCDAAEALEYTERSGGVETTVSVTDSMAALFDRSSAEAKALKPRLFIAWRMQGESQSIAAMLCACLYSRDETLGTDRFTHTYCAQHGIPRLGDNSLFIDVVSSRGQPHAAGALLVLTAYNMVMRSRALDYLCTIAVTPKMKRLCEQLGMDTFDYREEGAARTLAWSKKGDLSASDIAGRLRLHREFSELCWRAGATQRTQDKRYPRC